MKVLHGLVLLLAMALWGAPPSESATAAQAITIKAKRFSFEPAEITVHKGQPVTLLIQSMDVEHGLVVKELGIKTEVKKGHTAEVGFVPDRVGTFIGKCAHFCGIGHGSMKLTIHVTE